MRAGLGALLMPALQSVYLPGFSPSVPQQLKNTGLFGGEVTKQEIHGVSAEVRGDDGTSQIRTSEGLQHLWTRT